MNKDCNTCVCKEGSCYPSTTIFDKDKTCKSYAPDYEGYIAELEEAKANLEYLLEGRDNEIDELKKENKVLAQNLEDTEILNNTYEKRFDNLKKENAELKGVIDNDVDKKIYVQLANKAQLTDVYKDQLTKAKVALRNVIDYLGQFCSDYPDCVIEAEKIL